MQVRRNIHKINAEAPHLPEGNFLKNRIGFWGIVKDVNSLNNTVTVVSDTGFEYPNIQVKSDEWVTLDKDYVPSTRNLPPKKSRVFVLTPTFSAVGAFVVCSGFSRGDENIRSLWAKNKNELEDKNNCRETITQGGWDITEEYKNGNFKAVSISTDEGKIEITLNTTKDDNKSQPQEVSLKAWGNNIVITKDGISLVDKNNNKIDSTSDGIKVTDKNSNVLEMKSNEVDIKVGSNGSTIVATNSSVKINNHLEVLL